MQENKKAFFVCGKSKVVSVTYSNVQVFYLNCRVFVKASDFFILFMYVQD